MTNVLTEQDLTNLTLDDEVIAVIGYGSQGRAQALNLKDSGANVLVGLKPGSLSWDKAAADGFEVMETSEAVRHASLVAILVPDMIQKDLFEQAIRPNLRPGACLLFAHGFTIQFAGLELPNDLDVVLVAPKGPGDLVRKEYARGRGVPSLFAVWQNRQGPRGSNSGNARDRALAYAKGIGGARGGLIETTFAEETETDLFGEQAVLCGGVKELVKAGFETLVDAGYQPEVAYFECLHELKLIVDLFYEGGISRMHDFVSETAKYGALTSGPKIVDDATRVRMKDMLADIQSGAFAKRWIAEHRGGREEYGRLLAADRGHQIETVGSTLRSRMAWLNEPQVRKDQRRGEA
jgi:ketol-acid reductoisomerase